MRSVDDSSSSISDAAISRISPLVLASNGITLREIIARLEVSRTTAFRWLSLMQAEGLLNKTSVMEGTRGRPKVVYHPTDKLRTRAASAGPEPFAVVSFANLRAMCKYLEVGRCNLQSPSGLCAAPGCPIINS